MAVTSTVFILFFAFATPTAGRENQQDDKQEREQIQIVGTWTVVSAVQNGKESKSKPGETFRFSKDGTFLHTQSSGIEVEGTYKTAQEGDDCWIAMEVEEDKPELGGAGPRPGIFKTAVNKEMQVELTICIAAGGGLPRPDKFESPAGKHRLLMTLVKTEDL